MFTQSKHECPGTLDQQVADILVASLGNSEQGRSTAGTVLPWHQPHRSGEVSAASVLLPVAELRGEKTSGDGANTRNRQQALPEGVVGKLPLELFFDIKIGRAHV